MEDVELAQRIRAAIKRGDATEVAALLGADKDRLSMMTPFGTWLHVAASHGRLEIVNLLVRLGADVNARGGFTCGSALHLAASDGHTEVVKYLLECRAELDVSEPERNPLFGAIHSGHTEIAKLLIEAGIDTHVKYTGKSMQEMDAVAFAREWGRSDLAELILASQMPSGSKRLEDR